MNMDDNRTPNFDIMLQKVLNRIDHRSIFNLVIFIFYFLIVCVVPLLSGILISYVQYDKAWLFILAVTPIEFFVIWIVSLLYYFISSNYTIFKCYITTHILAATQFIRSFLFILFGVIYLSYTKFGGSIGTRKITANATLEQIANTNKEHLIIVVVSYCWLICFIYSIALINIESTAKKLIYLYSGRLRIASVDTNVEVEYMTRRVNWKLDSYMFMFFSIDLLAAIYCGGYIGLAVAQLINTMAAVFYGYVWSFGFYMMLLTLVLLAVSIPFTISDFINLKPRRFMIVTALLLIALLVQFTIIGVIPLTRKFLELSNFAVVQSKSVANLIDFGLFPGEFQKMNVSLAMHGLFFNAVWMSLIWMIHSLYVLFMALRMTKRTVAGLYIDNSRDDACDRDSIDMEDNVDRDF
ncbi:hypothetical protein PFISCL1PPCAC_2317 [Pristionchus fissidentatus]|uniref:G protein-coupled receptor n=1 Tax=Pristionchus fissidentatus TaxID=1538716 RepID=A0AAV5UXV3_9BILA|nr:hypothetical protein PFISCL1PPCAC_2317 [Pristionchus fissidentatus]